MSHLKLQKLLFYCDAYHLAYIEEPLLHQNFQAWVHGPVCIEVYHELKGHSVLYSDVSYDSKTEVKDPNKIVSELLTSKQLDIITEVLETLTPWKDSELEASTHREKPWIEARAGIPASQKCETVINKITTKDFYKKEILPR
jgi:uncharacterized phage-associated protein